MKRNRKALLAAGLLAGAAALTGCSASTVPAARPTPEAAQQVTAQPETADTTPTPSESPQAQEETSGPLPLSVGGKKVEAGAVTEEDGLFLPLNETAQALGWDASYEENESESGVKKTVQLEKEGSKITVAWSVSDNTARRITWQKDGLLIPVDAQLTTIGDTVYVPAAFFETAMRVHVSRGESGVTVEQETPAQTPPKATQDEPTENE